MVWSLSHRADAAAVPIADRHYNRQHVGSPQFVPPGRCLVLHMPTALWVTSWPLARYVKHEWAGAWVNSCFRREAGPVASSMIVDALAATRWLWPCAPLVSSAVGPVSMVTFIDREKVRRKRDYGRCYLKAGFEVIGETKGGLLALGIRPANMPDPEGPHGSQDGLFGTAMLPESRPHFPPTEGLGAEGLTVGNSDEGVTG